jgi:hypothetical protein
MVMAVGAFLAPGPIIGYRLRLLLVDGLEPLDRDVEVAHSAKVGVQPLQFIPYSGPFGVGNHRREKQNRCAQARERDTHLM